jgi:hypothetical protein
MKKIFTQTALALLLIIAASSAFSQVTVDIPCTGAVNPNSGRITGTGTTKSYGYLWHGVSQENRGWARFDVPSNVPSNATITAAEVIFWVETSSGSAGNNYLKFFTGNTGTMTAAQVWSAIGQVSAHEASNADLNPTGQKTRAINATGITFLNNNKTVILNLGFTRGSGNFGFRIHGSDGVGQNSTDVNKRPVLRITYTVPCTNPAISSPLANQSVCPNTSASFTVAATGTGLTYVWRKGSTPLTDGGNISGAGTATLTINPATAGDVASDYNVVVSGTCGSPVTSSNASLSLLNPAPAQPAAFTASTATVCVGTNGVAYTIDPVTNATSYNWSYSGTGATINGSGTSVTVNFSNNASSGTLSVTAQNSCGTSAARTISVTTNTVPAQPGTISGNNSFCGLGNKSYSIATVANTTSYTWAVSGGGSVVSGQGTAAVDINWTSGGAYTVSVTANNGCGSGTAATLQVSVTETTPAQPAAFTTSSATVCQGQNNVAYTVPTVSGATSYTWSYSGTGATINGTGNSVTVNFSSSATAGTLSVTADNLCGASTAQTLAVTINSVPATPSAFTTSSATVCQGATNVVYEVPAANGATSYNWTYSGTGATINGTGNSVTVNYSGSATAGSLSVSAQNDCGASVGSQTLAVTVESLPAAPASFTQSNATVCKGESNVAYVATAVNGATGYTWSYSGTGVTITDNGSSASLDFSSSATSGTLSLVAENNCGTGSALTLAITVNETPAAPSSFTTSSATACQGANAVAYEVAAVSGATSYNWTYSGTGATINGSGNAVTVAFAANATAGTLSVTAENACGVSNALTLAVSINDLPAAPSSFTTSSATACQGASTVAYEVAAVSGATSYNWTYSGTGATINGSGNAVTVAFAANATAGTLSVTAENACGISNALTLAVSVNDLPAAPSSFTTSSATACQGASTVAYEVAAVSGATSYNWTYSGTGATINGSGNAVTVAFAANATAGTLSVTAENACGVSNALTLAIAIDNIASTPANLAGDNSLCANETATYSVNAVTGVTFNWTLPNGWTGTSNTNSISVTANGTGGNISVTAQNSCGTSAAATLAITVNAAPTVTLGAFSNKCTTDAAFTLSGGSPAGGTYTVNGTAATTFNPATSGAGSFAVVYTYQDGNGCSNTATQNITVNVCSGIYDVLSAAIRIYPNPAADYVVLSIPTGVTEISALRIYDAQGKLVEQLNTNDFASTNEVRINTSKLANGIYSVQLSAAGFKVNRSLVIAK